jgi:hypothetical protein
MFDLAEHFLRLQLHIYKRVIKTKGELVND